MGLTAYDPSPSDDSIRGTMDLLEAWRYDENPNAAFPLSGSKVREMCESILGLRARLAEVERERDRATIRAHQVDMAMEHMEPDHHRALAAWQAEVARLREALEERGEHGRKCPWAYFSAGRPKDGGGYEMLYREAWYEVRPDDKRPACTCGLNAALASAPGSTDALRAMLKEAATEGINEGYGNGLSYGTERIEAIVSRILGERSDDAPQGRGERAKGGGDA